MPAIDFPNSPTLNQEFTSGDRTWIWDGSVWNSKLVSAPIDLGDLNDVNAPSPAVDDLLTWDGTDWVNISIAGAGISAVGHTHALDDLSDVTITTPATGQAITYNGSGWVNSAVSGLPAQSGNAGELLVTNGTDASWSNTVTANSASIPAIIAKGAVSQTGNIQEWQNSGGTALVIVDSAGSLNVKTGTGNGYVKSDQGGHLEIASGTTGNTPLWIYAKSGQTANLTDWMSSTGTALASIGPTGLLTAQPAIPSNTNSADNVGYVGMPQTSTATGITLSATHAGKHIYTTATGQTHTIPANSSVPLEIGTTIVFVNPASVTTTIAIITDTLLLAGTGTTGSRTLAPYGMATALKIAATTWIISGNGLS